MRTMLDEALDLLHWEWSIFPVHSVRKDGSCTCGRKTEDDGKPHKPGKHPRTKNGVKDACKDPQVVMEWWRTRGWMQSNIGLATGDPSGVWALDVDVNPPRNKAGEAVGMAGPDALAAYEAKNGALPETLESKTGSGGRHLFFRMPMGRNLRNHAKIKGPDGRTCSLDVRATGGYVVLPPSSHESGSTYEWTRKTWPPAEAPKWLLDLVDPPKVEHKPVGASPARYDATRAEQYAEAALDNACKRISSMGEDSGRNNALTKEGFTLGGFVGAGCLQEFKAREDLVNAGIAAGLSEREARDTVSRALMAGAMRPTQPQLQERERPAWEREAPPMPPAPEDDGYWESMDDVPPPGPPDDDVGQAIYADPMEPDAALPAIVAAKRQGLDVIKEAWAAVLARNNPPRLWLQNGSLVGVRKSERGPSIRILNPTDMLGHLMRSARWVKWRKARPDEASKNGFVHEDMDHPPTFVADDMHAAPDERLPILEGIVFAPCYSQKGRILDMIGYNPDGRCYYDAPHGFKRTPMDAQEAMRLLFGDWLGDFPFAADSDRAHALALLLLPFVRRMIDGPTPLHIIEAPAPGSGKSLLAKCLCIVAIGREPDATPWADNEEERRKAFLTRLASGNPTIFVDNIKGRIESPTVEGMLTSTTWADRALGVIGEIRVPNLATWIATVNNADVCVDMARRAVRIRLDAKVERPEDRTGFRVQGSLETWTAANRDRLISACMAVVDHWLANRPTYSGPVMGSFESWAETMGGIVQSLGLPGFLGDRQAFRDAADIQGRDWAGFVELVTSRPVIDQWRSVRELVALADEQGFMAWAMGDGNERSRQIRLGKVLSKRRDTVANGWRLEVGSTRNGTAFRFVRVDV